ncbi:hypothetical protein [Alkalihalobacterium elongatum]|uniref:hypothetical protein n=1 Tax=Alkalihalobacterium elongatum TaxID=2675466 RepID=UPI001C1FDFD0|nr:hypothetical protein [Alkalihalobacterium elongatum]
MSEWLNSNKKAILYGILIFFLILAAFYFYFVKPLQAEERSQQEELQRVHTEIATYQTKIDKLTPQTLTSLQRKALLDRVPMRANVEQVIADLEKTELKTSAVIEDVSISIHNNENEQIEGTEGVEENEPESWKHIFDDELYSLLESQVTDVNQLNVSYVELNINMNGKEEDVHSFIEEIEKLKRIIHVQSYDFSLDDETDRLEANLNLRAFYCEDFSEFIDVKQDFKLDYKFDQSKLNRYIEVNTEVSSGTETNNETGTSGENTNTTPSTTDSSSPSTSTESKPVQQTQRYFQSTLGEADANLAFYVVQTGGYNTEPTLYEQVTKLRNAGIYPREIEREKNQSNETRFVVYTGLTHDLASAERLANYLTSLNKDFKSWVDYLPYRVNNTASLAKEAHDVVIATTAVVTNGINEPNYQLPVEQMELISAKIRVYELKAKEAINSSSDTNLKIQLENTLTYVKQIENALKQYQSQNNRAHLWQAQGAMLDFILTLNGYVSYTEK